MGADFCFSWVAIKEKAEKTAEDKMLNTIKKFNIPELSENKRQKILNKLKETESENFKEFCGLWEEGLNGDFEEGKPVEFIEDKKTGATKEVKVITENRAKEIMKEVVNGFFRSRGFRDMGSFNFKGYQIYLSGGLSYGDNPTDDYETINKLLLLPNIILKAGSIY